MIMKKISLLLMVSLLSTGLFAQKAPAVSYGNNELDLSYGLFTTPQFVDIFVDIFSAVFSFGTVALWSQRFRQSEAGRAFFGCL